MVSQQQPIVSNNNNNNKNNNNSKNNNNNNNNINNNSNFKAMSDESKIKIKQNLFALIVIAIVIWNIGKVNQ